MPKTGGFSSAKGPRPRCAFKRFRRPERPATAALPNGTGLWYLGQRWDAVDHYKGQMDEVRIWNRALTASELAAARDCELSGAPSGLVARYRFNQGLALANNSGVTTLTDSSGNSLNGTLTNFTLSGSTSNWVALGSSSTFVVAFAPSAVGDAPATVRIANNDPDETPYTFGIGGAGAGQLNAANQVTQQSFSVLYHPVVQPCGAELLPIHTITPTLTNNTIDSLRGLYFVVTELRDKSTNGAKRPLCVHPISYRSPPHPRPLLPRRLWLPNSPLSRRC